MKSPHQVLGISPNATLDEAKQAYRRLARRYHPDVSTEPDAEQRFKEVAAAWEAIKNPQPQSQSHHGFEDFHRGFSFDDFLRGFGGAGTVLRTVNISVTLPEAYTGVSRTLSVAGSTTDIKLPAGIRSGTQFSVDQHHVITVTVQPHEKFARNGDDLLLKTSLSLSQAVLGCEVEFAHINGRSYRVSIPSGIQPGQTVRMRGLGMPNPQWSGKSGDLFVQALVEIPDAQQLTESQKQSIIQLGYQSIKHV